MICWRLNLEIRICNKVIMNFNEMMVRDHPIPPPSTQWGGDAGFVRGIQEGRWGLKWSRMTDGLWEMPNVFRFFSIQFETKFLWKSVYKKTAHWLLLCVGGLVGNLLVVGGILFRPTLRNVRYFIPTAGMWMKVKFGNVKVRTLKQNAGINSKELSHNT